MAFLVVFVFLSLLIRLQHAYQQLVYDTNEMNVLSITVMVKATWRTLLFSLHKGVSGDNFIFEGGEKGEAFVIRGAGADGGLVSRFSWHQGVCCHVGLGFTSLTINNDRTMHHP